MGCAPSTVDGGGSRRRGWVRVRALGQSVAFTTGLQTQGQQGQEAEAESSSSSAGRRGSKVAPEPKEHEEEAPAPAAAAAAALPSMPGSPSFRYYCQKKTAAVDKIVADSDGAARIRATTRQVSKRNDVAETNAHESSQVSEPKEEHKEGARWPKFKGLSMVTTAWHNLFSRHTRKPSLPPAVESHHPPAATAAA